MQCRVCMELQGGECGTVTGYRGAALRDGGAGAVGSAGLGGEAVHQVEELRLWAALAFCC